MITSNKITALFIFGTLFITLCLWAGRKEKSLIANTASTMGVLGTFVGIFFGLQSFDPSNIQDSIPPLLEGLKTAFITSIVGMVASMLVKIFYKEPVSESDSLPIVVEDEKSLTILSNLVNIANEIKRLTFTSIEKTESLVNGSNTKLELVGRTIGENLNSVGSIIDKTIRDSTTDIEIRIEKFGEIVAEQSSKELISAIQKVMEDFNAKINDQLGQSFQDLTESCKLLNQWQQQHVHLLREIEESSNKLLDNFDNASILLDNFSESEELFFNNHKRILEFLEITQKSIDTIQRVGDNFRNVMPAIELRMDENTQKFSDIITGIDATSGQFIQTYSNMAKQMNDAMQIFSEHLTGVLKRFSEDIRSIRSTQTTQN